MLTGPPPKFHGTRDILLDPATREISVRTRAGFDEAAATGVESVRRFAAAMLG